MPKWNNEVEYIFIQIKNPKSYIIYRKSMFPRNNQRPKTNSQKPIAISHQPIANSQIICETVKLWNCEKWKIESEKWKIEVWIGFWIVNKAIFSHDNNGNNDNHDNMTTNMPNSHKLTAKDQSLPAA